MNYIVKANLPATDSGKNFDLREHLSDISLFQEAAYINGEWVGASSTGHPLIYVTNPANGQVVGHVPDFGAPEARRAIEAAATAFPGWAACLPQERARILRRWHDLMLDAQEDLALIMTLEQGKPFAESMGEIAYAASFLDWFADEAKRLNGQVITPHLNERTMVAKRQAIGVTAAVTPWNFPSAMITRKAAAALAAGCPMVVRPASETPFSALALAALAEQAGVPAGVFSVITGDPEAVVGEFLDNPTVRALSFTGSTQVGRKLLARGGQTVKKMSMELGGHAPFIVGPDADMADAVAGAMDAKFATSGQDCLAANRIYVPRALYTEFVSRFAAATAALKVGPGLEDGVTIGPLMHERAIAKCAEQVADAKAKGAKVICGGQQHPAGPLFYQPTILADVTDDMLIASEETFGPIAAIMPYDTEAEVITRANATEYGLAAYLWSNNIDFVNRLSDALEFGMVAVNCVKITGGPIPFGGVKQSGLGREGGHWSLEDYTEVKYICTRVRAA